MGKTIVYDNFEWDEEKTESIVRSMALILRKQSRCFLMFAVFYSTTLIILNMKTDFCYSA